MKTKAIITIVVTVALMAGSCSQDIDAPTLPMAESVTIAQGVTLSADVLFGVWEGKTIQTGTTKNNTFEQTYRLDFQSVDDAEVLVSHWFADARTNDRDSVMNMTYHYSFDGTSATMKPLTKGLSTMKVVHIGNTQMELYAIEGNSISKVCTLVRTSDPEPVITSVDRTLPQVGEVVTVSGRNLQFVDHLYLPTTAGELEVTNFTKSSRQIQFEVPNANYVPGAIRGQATGAHVSTYSPAYMFCSNSIFFKTFSTDGGSKPYWTGTDYENTIGINNGASDMCKIATPIDAANIPAGHALSGKQVKNPDHFLSFFGDTPKAWPVDTSLDPNNGHIRFSFGDCIQRVLDNSEGLLTADTKCADVAIQMDVYVYSDGEPVWKTGFISFRMDKDQSKSLTQGWFAQTAMWDINTTASFADGWKTFTIPLPAFTELENAYETLGKLSAYLLSKKKVAIVKFLNYQLDATHPAQELSAFQFCMANMRLVSTKAIANKKE